MAICRHIHVASLVLRTSVKSLFKATTFLLGSQYIRDGSCGRVVRMIKGGSQGKSQSGAIAVASFMHAKEFNGPALACRRTHVAYGILDYVRYIDNMLFVLRPGVSSEPDLQLLEQEFFP